DNVQGQPDTWTQIATLLNTNETFEDTNILAGNTYWYRVVAFNIVGDSDYSAVATVPVVSPATPSFYVDAVADSAYVNWFAGTPGLQTIFIQRAPDVRGAPGAWKSIYSTATDVANDFYTDANLAANTTYWYRVRATNWIGASAYSEPLSVTITP